MMAFKRIAPGLFSFSALLLAGSILYWFLLPALLVKTYGWVLKKEFLVFDFNPLSGIIGITLIGYASYMALKCSLLFWVLGEGLPFFFIPPKRIIRTSFYRWIRHPIYTAFSLYLIGWIFLLPYHLILLPLLILVLLFLVLLAMVEEKKLMQRSTDYKDYRKGRGLFLPSKLPTRKEMLLSPTMLYLILHIILHDYLKWRFHIRMIGLENIPDDRPVLIVANHNSYLDPVFIAAMIPRQIRFLTTYEVYRKPINRIFFNLVGSIPLKRHEPGVSGLRNFLKLAHRGIDLGYFYEGERCWYGYKNPVPEGVYNLLKRIPSAIIPVCLHGTYDVMPRWSNLIRTARVTIQFFPPLDLKQIKSQDEFVKVMYEMTYYLHDRGAVSEIMKGNRTGGIQRLFWACPLCGTLGSLLPENEAIFSCINCQEKWRMDHHNLINDKNGKRFYHHSFYFLLLGRVTDNIKTYLSRDVVLLSERVRKLYKATHKIFRIGVLKLVSEGIVFTSSNYNEEIKIEKIRTTQIEGNDRLHIITWEGILYRYRFPEEDSALKWLFFINTLQGKEYLKRRRKGYENKAFSGQQRRSSE